MLEAERIDVAQGFGCRPFLHPALVFSCRENVQESQVLDVRNSSIVNIVFCPTACNFELEELGLPAIPSNAYFIASFC